MNPYLLNQYLDAAMNQAEFDRLALGVFAGHAPGCPGVVVFESSLTDCKMQLRAAIEEWLLTGLRTGHTLPVIGEIDLNQEVGMEAMEQALA